MKTLDEIKNLITEHKKILNEKYKVKKIGVFGSYARGEQKKGSDLDIIIEFKNEESIGGLEFVGLMTDLEEYFEKILGIKPHLASKRQAVNSDRWKYVEKELMYL